MLPPSPLASLSLAVLLLHLVQILVERLESTHKLSATKTEQEAKVVQNFHKQFENGTFLAEENEENVTLAQVQIGGWFRTDCVLDFEGFLIRRWNLDAKISAKATPNQSTITCLACACACLLPRILCSL